MGCGTLAAWCNPAKLVKEVEYEHNFARLGAARGLRTNRDCEPLTVGMQIKSAVAGALQVPPT